MIVVGTDPSLSNFGWGVLRLRRDAEEVLDAGLIRTEPEAKKKRLRQVDDDQRRTHDLVTAFHRAIHPHLDGIVAICSEAPVPAGAKQGARAIKTGAIGQTVVLTVAAMLGVPVLQVTPQELKVGCGLPKTATKEAVWCAMVERFGEEQLAPILALARTKREHPTDALGAVVACLESETIRAVRRAVAV